MWSTRSIFWKCNGIAIDSCRARYMWLVSGLIKTCISNDWNWDINIYWPMLWSWNRLSVSRAMITSFLASSQWVQTAHRRNCSRFTFFSSAPYINFGLLKWSADRTKVSWLMETEDKLEFMVVLYIKLKLGREHGKRKRKINDEQSHCREKGGNKEGACYRK